jgi:hypothetical protein
MLLELNEGLEDKIVRLLGRHTLLSVTELIDLLQVEDTAVSLQAVYKQLSKLDDGLVVTKVGKKYRLNLAWVMEVASFVGDLESDLLKRELKFPEIPDQGRVSWTFSNLVALHKLWVHLILALYLSRSDSLLAYEWFPLPWFALVNRRSKKKVRRTVQEQRKQVRFVFGNQSYLARICAADLPPDIYQCSFDISGLVVKYPTDTFVVFDDYIITVEMTQKFVNNLKNFFEDFRPDQVLSREDVAELIGEKGRFRLVIERNEKRSKVLFQLLHKAFVAGQQAEARL